MRRGLSIMLLGALLFAGASYAAIEVHKFDDPAKATMYRQLTTELRCLVCQNQDIADSNADLAKDLRNEIYKMIEGGAGKKQVIDFMVARYGDFVLYRPPVKPTTYLLWFGPFVLGVLGLILLIRFVRARAARPAITSNLSSADRERLDDLLGDNRNQNL